MNIICSGCGEEIETLPLKCAHSININSETNQMECYMENCGAISINEFVCEKCCTKRNIMKVNKTIEQLALDNEEFKDELNYFDKKVIQAKIPNSDFSYWVEFGNGVYMTNKGLKDNPTVTLNCPQNNMNQILKGNISPFTEFFNGTLKIEGDIQYALVYFDLVKLGLEINEEIGGV